MEAMTVKTHRFYIFWRTGLFLLLWWILSDGDTTSWWIGIPTVLLATTVSIKLVPPVIIAWSGIIRFIPFFLLHSLLGGIDVARRVFQPKMSIAPDLFEFPMRLPPGLPQVLMANTVGLLPGTLSVEIEHNVLTVHALDKSTDILAELEAVERSVARIFGKPLDNLKGVE